MSPQPAEFFQHLNPKILGKIRGEESPHDQPQNLDLAMPETQVYKPEVPPAPAQSEPTPFAPKQAGPTFQQFQAPTPITPPQFPETFNTPTGECLYCVVAIDSFKVPSLFGAESYIHAQARAHEINQRLQETTLEAIQAASQYRVNIPPPQLFICPTMTLKVQLGELFDKCTEHPVPFNKLQTDEEFEALAAVHTSLKKFNEVYQPVQQFLNQPGVSQRYMVRDGNSVLRRATNQVLYLAGLMKENQFSDVARNVEAMTQPDLVLLVELGQLALARRLGSLLYGNFSIPESVEVRGMRLGCRFTVLVLGGEEFLVTEDDLIYQA